MAARNYEVTLTVPPAPSVSLGADRAPQLSLGVPESPDVTLDVGTVVGAENVSLVPNQYGMTLTIGG